MRSNPEDVFDIYLDAVDGSPTQIPKNPVIIPALSLAPYSSPAKTQAMLKKPPDEGIIPAPSTAPPHNQNSIDLSVPTIRSRLNYEAIPIKFAYLIDVEDYSSEDKLRSHAELLTENRRRRRVLTRKIKELNDKDEIQKSRKPEEKYRCDALSRKLLHLSSLEKNHTTCSEKISGLRLLLAKIDTIL